MSDDLTPPPAEAWRGLYYRHGTALDEWLAGAGEEPALEPEMPIIDAHHHLWMTPKLGRYLLQELLADIDAGGHNTRATVYIQGHAMYRQEGPESLRSLGETEFATGIAAMAASGTFGRVRACAGIIGYVDLRAGAEAEAALQAHIAIAGDRFRGVRQSIDRDTGEIARLRTAPATPPGLLADPQFRAGFPLLARHGLVYESWQYHHQLPELIDLARAFPQTTIVVDHCGGPVRVAHWAGRGEEVFQAWHAHIRELARLPNVIMKLGGLGMLYAGFPFHLRDRPPGGAELAAGWRNFIEPCIQAFGPERTMFESNFPVDRQSCTYRAMWNAFKIIAARYSPAEQAAMFHGTAAQIYRLDPG